MKRALLICGCALYAGAVSAATPTSNSSAAANPASAEGLAVAIVYDTSGSMRDAVRDRDGKQTPKYIIANRALEAIVGQLGDYSRSTTSNKEPRRVEAGLYIFKHDGAQEAVAFGRLDVAALQGWARSFREPNGNTPLGAALNVAAQATLRSPMTRKHVLVITDGKNTAGPQPGVVMTKLKKQTDADQTKLSVHFVAFDVDAKEFESVKKQGATVVSAADEKQLTSQLDFILKRKILLEDEEPAKK